MASRASGLAILESEWFDDRRDASVLDMFRTLARSKYRNQSQFLYERFVGERSFFEAATFFCEQRGCRWLYIAGHGDNSVRGNEDVIGSPNKRHISRRQILEFLKGPGNKLEGIHFGSCLFANQRNSDAFLKNDNVNLKWVVGYDEEVDWVQSTCLDILFWNDMIGRRGDRTQISRVGNSLKTMVPDLAKLLRFDIHYLDGNDIKSVFDWEST